MRKKSTSEYRSFSTFTFRVPTSLARISRRCLALDAVNRYPNAATLLAVLQKAHRSTSPKSPPEVIREFISNPAHRADCAGVRPIRLARCIRLAAAAVVTITLALAPRFLQPAIAPRPTHSPVLSTAAAPAIAVPPLPATPANREQAATPSVPALPVPKPPAATKPEPPRRTIRSTSPPKVSAPTPRKRPRVSRQPPPPFQSGMQALRKKAWREAIEAFQPIAPTDTHFTQASIYLLEAYLHTDQLDQAGQLVRERHTITDAQFDLYAGEAARRSGDTTRALEFYQTAMLKPSRVRDLDAVRSDALCFIARLHTTRLQRTPSLDNRLLALNAWVALKRHLAANPSQPRYQEATSTIALIQQATAKASSPVYR